MPEPGVSAKIRSFLLAPFPRPKPSRKNILLVLLFGAACTTFIYLFNPYNISNQSGEGYADIILMSMGLVFSMSIIAVEFGIPALIPRPFSRWNLAKAVVWYSLALLIVGAVIFLYKSYLGGFRDFTLTEYVFVLGRLFGIGIVVSFFTLGLISYVNRRKLSLLSAGETYRITTPNAPSLELNLNDILYVSSDDNYVDIHLQTGGARKKEVFRSSLKNVEAQLVNPVSPIYRCHRKYLINIRYFEVQKMTSRNMTVVLKDHPDEIPVSKRYADRMNELLQTRP